MGPALSDRLKLSEEEQSILSALLDSERTKLMVEIRHTAHRTYRDELRRKLDMVEHLIGRCRPE
jgi:hypothetical protein